MKLSLQLEELTQFIASIIILIYLDVDISWWLWPIVFLSPDIGMLGYLVNPGVGAWTYNFFHYKGVALIVLAFGFFLGIKVLIIAGVILLGHAAMDRALGYGLKYSDSFKHTHLGTMN